MTAPAAEDILSRLETKAREKGWAKHPEVNVGVMRYLEVPSGVVHIGVRGRYGSEISRQQALEAIQAWLDLEEMGKGHLSVARAGGE